MSSTATLDPTEAITAAVRELYEQLREIVDRGPTDDPSLLDELGKLTGKIRNRITRARKRAEPAPAAPTAAESATPAPAEPAPAVVTAAPASTTAVALPAAIPAAPAGERLSIRLADQVAEPASRVPAVTVTAVPAPAATSPTPIPTPAPRRGRHRVAGLPWWAAAIAIVLTVSGVGLAFIAGQPAWSLTAASLAGWALVAWVRPRRAAHRAMRQSRS